MKLRAPSLPESTRPASKTRGRGFTIAVGLAGLAGALLLLAIGFVSPNGIPGRGYYTIKVEFKDADNLTAHNQVRIGGKNVGQVLERKPEGDHSVVTLQLYEDVKPLLSSTTVRVRPRSAIGVRFVEIHPGREGDPLKDGDTIPLKQTSATVPLDSVLGVLDPRTRTRTRELIDELGAGFLDRGQDVNAILGRSGSLTTNTNDLMRAIVDRRPGSTAKLVRGAEGAAATAAPVRASIAAGFRPEADALAPFSQHGRSLRSTLDVAPGALANSRVALGQAAPLLDETSGLATDALPMLREAPGALRSTRDLLVTGRQSLKPLDRTLRLARRAVGPTIQLTTTLRPLLPTLDATFRAARAPLRALGPRGCDIRLMVTNWTSMLAFGDDRENYLRLNVISPTQESGGGTGGGSAPNELRTGVLANPYPEPCTVRNDRNQAATPGGGGR